MVVVEAVQGVPAGCLVALLLGVAFAAAALMPFDDDLRAEERRAVLGLRFVHQDIFEVDLVLLAPFQQLALEVDLLPCKLVNVDMTVQYSLRHEALAVGIPAVQVDGAHEGFEGIACHVAVVRLVLCMPLHEFVEPYLHGQPAQRLALHDFAARVGQESFALAGEVMVDYLAHDGVEHGIAQKFQTFVVDGRSALAVRQHRLVHQGFLVQADVVRIEAQHITKGAIKLLLLAER